MKKSNKGFTLVEILIVVVIAVSVAAFGVPAYKKSQERNRYLAAQGVLIDLGNAVRTFRQDMIISCEAAGLSSKTFPTDGSVAQLVSSWQTTEKDAELNTLNSTADMGAAMFTRKYMTPVAFTSGDSFKGYSFYVCPLGGSSSGCCGGSSDVVACMKDSATSSNYEWAHYLQDGTIVQSN
jgi:prepilin-type N-terminal cleavage/methylation domain-containing protein